MGEHRVERRASHRRKSRVNKTLHAELTLDGESSHVFVFIVDISTGGIRLNLDRALERESLIGLKLPVGAFVSDPEYLEVTCRVVWHRALLGGTWVHGLEFKNLSAIAAETVQRLYDAFTPEGRRKRFRLNSVLSIAYHLDGEWNHRAACDLSPEGLGLQMRDPLPLEAILPLKIYLEEAGAPLEAEGEVIHTTELENGLHRVGIEFRDPDEAVLDKIRAYIDASVSRDLGN